MPNHIYKYNWDFLKQKVKNYITFKVYIGPRLRILGNHGFLTKLNKITKDFYPHKTNAMLKKGKENVYIVTYNFSTATDILEWLYEDGNMHLKRKYTRFLEVSKSKR